MLGATPKRSLSVSPPTMGHGSEHGQTSLAVPAIHIAYWARHMPQRAEDDTLSDRSRMCSLSPARTTRLPGNEMISLKPPAA